MMSVRIRLLFIAHLLNTIRAAQVNVVSFMIAEID